MRAVVPVASTCSMATQSSVFAVDSAGHRDQISSGAAGELAVPEVAPVVLAARNRRTLGVDVALAALVGIAAEGKNVCCRPAIRSLKSLILGGCRYSACGCCLA